MRARLDVARAAGDRIGEKESATRLARWLASRDRALDEASALGRRSLELGEDPDLRLELSTWLESIGDAAAAAHVLRPLAAAASLESDEAARILTRVGVLHARAGAAAASSDAFIRAAATHVADAQPLELLGSLSAWAPDVVAPKEAAEAYVEAATRRFAAGALDAQMEDLLRAFDLDPTSSPAVAALATALTDRGKLLAADEAWRAHARALLPTEPKRAATVHARRRLHARAADDIARALGAALDEGLDAHMVGDGADVMDDLLLRVGLLEPLAARLEIRAEATSGAEQARTLEELARLFAGPLARPDRAAASRVLALAADPTEEDALVALRADASASRDATLLVEGLVRAIGRTTPARDPSANDPTEPEPRRAARLAHARALASLAEHQLNDSALATWAYGAVLRFEPGDNAASAGLARHADRWEMTRHEIEALKQSLHTVSGDSGITRQWEGPPVVEGPIESLRALAVLFRSRPDEEGSHAEVLAELVRRAKGERRWLTEATRLAWRRGDFNEVTRLSEEHLSRAENAAEIVDARTALALAYRRTGDMRRANSATIPLLGETPGNRRAIAAVWVNAALADDAGTRGAAIELLASACSPSVKAAMLAVYADTLRDSGDGQAARQVAEKATQAAPSSARSVATLADAAVGAHDRTAASALERGINLVFARGAWCAGLADALEAIGELGYAVGWTQRGVTLRPGDRLGIETLLRRIGRARDGARLADALSWALSQPHPTGPLSDVVAQALRELALLDTDRAAVLARRALDVFGAGRAAMRTAMIEVADLVRDDAFACVVLERALAVEFSSDRASLVRMLVRRRAALGDPDGEARALVRAVREGFADADLEERLGGLVGTTLSGDGEIARLEATAELLTAKKDKDAAALVWRELGAMLWDLAGDRLGALRAWLSAARLGPRGFVTLGMDLARFAGARYALDRLAELVDKESNRARSGELAAEAARAALALGEPGRALDLAAVAIERNPRLADALEIAEKGAVSSARAGEMTRLYDGIAGAALGRFGRRAAHYRGARFFDHRNDPGLALKHAAQAFHAVPSEGAAFVLLRRMAERADDRMQALRTIVQVAEATPSQAARAGWLLRASAVAGDDEEGCRLRVDVLLRASVLVPDIGTLALLEQAVTGLLRIAPEERESLEMRLARAGQTITAKTEGPEAARVALRFAHIGLELLENDTMGLHALERALSADADLDEYASLGPFARRLAQADDAGAAIERLLALTERPYANVGLPALELLAAMAAARGDEVAEARFLILALEKEPEDPALVRRTDAAVRGSKDPSLVSRLDAVAPAARRAAVLRAWARERTLDGAHEEASRALERAADLTSDRERAAVERELVAAYEASGKAEEVEERAIKEATNEGLSVAVRAVRWTEVALKRETRGDLVGAVDALLAAAALDGAPIERWSALERVAELAGSEEVRVQAIREIAHRVDPDARAAVNKRLARAYEARGDMNAAEATWHAILDQDPSDEEADYALEALITGRGDYSDLANHLAKRVERLSHESGTREALRAVRIRRAAILEQRLSRTGDACDELARVLEESPDNVGALSYLADLQERIGEYARAAPLWKRVAALARDVKTQNEIELRAARAAAAGKDYASALASAREVLAREAGQREALELRVEAARALRNDRELGDALEEMSMSGGEEGATRSEVLLEASAAASRAGDWQAALARAQYAARGAPGYARAQLVARTLEYRARGAGTPDDAKRTVEDLAQALGPMQKDEAATHAFLSAEALDTFQGGGAGLAVLLARQDEIGGHPLLALGIAERLVAKFEFAAALPHFQAALLGDTSDLRERGRIALGGADAAIRVGEHEVAIRLLEEAAIEGPTRGPALVRAAQLASSRGEVGKAINILTDLVDSVDGEERARALAQLRSLQDATGPHGSHEETSVRPPSVAPPRAADSAPVERSHERSEAPHPDPLVSTPRDMTARSALARAHLDRGSFDAAERCLSEGLASGEMGSGDMLASLLEEAPERTSDLVRVRRQLVELAPGDLRRLEDLRRAALADKNIVYARALEHVGRAFDPGAGPLPPPALGAQNEQPGLLALLTRASSDHVAQALACVWEEAPGLFATDAAILALEGAERVQAGGSSPIARLYEAAMRLLDIRPVPLFVRRKAEPFVARVVMTSPPSALLLGCPTDDNSAVRFALGEVLASALPTSVLAVAPEPLEARAIWEAVVTAFGPPEASRSVEVGKGRLAEALWQALPARTQRRLQVLLAAVGPNDLSEAVERTRQAGRRVGLFLTGDFGFSARMLLAEAFGSAGNEPVTLDGQSLGQLCATYPAILDLFRLATSPEYADARWRPGSPSSHSRLRAASGRFGGV
jgi:Tfp pilus assembly protein PilF